MLTSAGFDPKVGAWAVAAGAAAAPPNWNREGAVPAAWVEVVGGAPKAKVELVVVVGAPKAGTAVLVAPKAAVVVDLAESVTEIFGAVCQKIMVQGQRSWVRTQFWLVSNAAVVFKQY